ncbi:MAG: TetR/AcrR family transcriptional regulator [Cryobacterium sp.]|uniref:TetR/AcrR family transcriptional regulator n=1 Tax=unclassified Cryobacterium TaxID=2649013 RepID=UPI0018CB3FE2|nr:MULTISPECIES: TetR/AcrR family transcriptional regulator [unclassified Cryobacterium]MCY7403774.1 TetR/AcrR family transcriptional regulator [Cryobacterium sp.]MEC5154176.1 AcrR family transcriptional regulator [Cryobacterium sp. CAN_C3]
MSSLNIAPDRRAELKARYRQAILDAADSLIRERGKPHFSVDELAERADVSRRTVFNHFSSLEDVIMTTCTRLLSATVDEFRAATASTPAGDGTRESLFEEITSALRHVDLPPVVAYLAGVLTAEGETGRSQHGIGDVFTRTTEQLSIEIAERTNAIDEFEVAVLVSSVMNGIAVVSGHWLARTAGALDSSSRTVWDELLDRLISTLCTGYETPDHQERT